MAYNEFAYFYDEFNGEADYEALYAHIKKELEAHGIHDGILADLGCAFTFHSNGTEVFNLRAANLRQRILAFCLGTRKNDRI